MKIGLLIIASEVLEGKITDLNTRSLSLYLKKHHLELNASLTVPDEISIIHKGLKTLWETCDLVISSGGLGPTQDDLTKLAFASYLGRTVTYSHTAHEVALKNYEKFNRLFPGKDHGYCFLPEGFLPLSNSTGFAPGFFTEHLGKYLFCAPGVPREFNSMLEDHLESLLLNKVKGATFLDTVIVRTKKVPEEKIFTEVDSSLWDKLAQYGSVSSLPILYGVDIGVKLKASSQSELLDKKNAVLKIFHTSPVMAHVWHLGPESVEEVIVKKATEKNLTFGFAESCTGGLCSHRITNISGSSQVFLGSIVSYDAKVKTALLNVSLQTIQKFDVVSEQVAQEMALGLVKNLNVDIAVSLTGLAGPSGGTPEKPIGTVCIGISSRQKVESYEYKFVGDREVLKNRFAQVALFHLLDSIEIF